MTENALPQVVYLPVDWIHVRHNPRQKLDPGRQAELAESVRRVGILQPIVVRRAPGQLAVPGYWLVCGHRRLVAAREAGLATVPAIVRELSDQEAREVQLVENLQRQDLDPIDEAQAFRELLDQHDYTQETLAQRLGISQAQLSNRLRLLRLPGEVQQNISREIISAGHGLALLRLEKAPQVLVRAAHHLAETKAPVARAAEAVEHFVADKGKPLEPAGVTGAGAAPRFAVAGCRDCPNRVQGRPPWGVEKSAFFCVDPGCWDRKQADADKQIEAAQLAEAQELAARGVEVLASEDVSKLDWNAYASLDPNSYELRGVDLTGCDDTCPHRKLVRRPHRDEPLPHCFNPPCLRKKKAAATRTATAAKQAAHDTRVAAIRAWAENAALAVFCEEPVPGGPADFDATLLLAALVLANVQPDWRYGESFPKVQVYLKRTRSWDLGLTAAASSSALTASAWPALKALLVELDGERLLALALEWAALNLGRTEMMRWAMGEKAEPVEEKAAAAPYGGDDLDEEEDGPADEDGEAEEDEPDDDEPADDEDEVSDDDGPDDEAA